MPTTSFTTRVRRAARASALLLSMAFAGCSSDRSTGTHGNSSPVGTYSLRQVDGSGLPVEVYHGPYFDAPNHHFYDQLIITITDGDVELTADGRFTLSIDMTVDGDGEIRSGTQFASGSYEVQGDAISFVPDDGIGEPQVGTLRRGAITIDVPMTAGKAKTLTYHR